MKFLSNVGVKVKHAGSIVGRKVSAKSPEILLVLGAASFVGTIVLACKAAANKSGEVKEKHERRMLEIDNSLEIASEDSIEVDEEGNEIKKSYTLEEARKDRFTAYCETGLGYARIYAPAILLGTFSLVCFGASYGIMKKRTVAISALYSASEKAFNEYRERVKKELGEEKDKQFRYGYEKLKGEKIAFVDEDGNEKVTKQDIDTVPWDEDVDGIERRELGDGTFEFAPWTTFKYADNDILDSTTLSVSRENMQYKFDHEESLFLNDVLHDLGMKKIPEGQLVGWKKGMGDPYIDYRVQRIYHELPKNDPVHNPKGLKYQITYKLEFNTCGLMWNKI